MTVLKRLFILFFILLAGFVYADNIIKKAFVRGDNLFLVFAHAVDTEKFRTFKLVKPGSVRYVFDIHQSRLESKRVPLGLRHDAVSDIRISQYRPHTVRVVIETDKRYRMSHRRKSSRIYQIALPAKIRSKRKLSQLFSDLISDSKPVHKKPNKPSRSKVNTPNKKSTSLKESNPSAIHLKRHYKIIVDPGHGGHDTGAIGGKKREKDLVLQISKRLRRHLVDMGFSVIMTRSSNRYVKLKNRTRYANKQNGDIFVSIHANSVSSKKRANRHGIETYFLKITKSSRAKRVAARENSVVLKKSDRLSNNVILNSVMTGPKIVLSNKLAIDIQRYILGSLRSKYGDIEDGGVRPAPFWVLVGAEMPAVLVETGYLSNPKERKRLSNSHYQDLLAKGIAEGIANYLKNRERELE